MINSNNIVSELLQKRVQNKCFRSPENNVDNQYKKLLISVLSEGTFQNNRTGVDTIFIVGEKMKFDLEFGFPVLTLRKAPWKSSAGEMIAFINGHQNAEQFRALKCNFWNKNANDAGLPGHENKWLSSQYRKGVDDLGEVYGAQWRRWLQEDGTYYDQFYSAIDQILNNPTSRRIIVNGWRPDRFDRMALPPCHVMYQFLVNVEKRELNMNMYIRSNDLYLGAPANIIEYAFLLEIVAHATGLKAKYFNYFVGDAHIYVNHFDAVNEVLSRKEREQPKLVFKRKFTDVRNTKNVVNWLEGLHPDDFDLYGYESHPEITGVEMAV